MTGSKCDRDRERVRSPSYFNPIQVRKKVARIHGGRGQAITVQPQKIRDYRDIENKLPQKTMLNQLQLLPGAISELLASVADTGRVTLLDRYGLLAATLDENLPEEERLAVNRLLRAIARGRVEVAF